MVRSESIASVVSVSAEEHADESIGSAGMHTGMRMPASGKLLEEKDMVLQGRDSEVKVTKKPVQPV